MAITLEEIAKLAGVSRATASRVFNDRPGVRPEVRERVWRIIRERDYRPNPAAQSLAAQRSDSSAASAPEPKSTPTDTTPQKRD